MAKKVKLLFCDCGGEAYPTVSAGTPTGAPPGVGGDDAYYFAGAVGVACPALACTSFSTDGATMISSWACGFFGLICQRELLGYPGGRGRLAAVKIVQSGEACASERRESLRTGATS